MTDVGLGTGLTVDRSGGQIVSRNPWRVEASAPMQPDEVTFQTRILRKQSDLPRYVVVHPDHVPGRRSSFTALVTLNDTGPFERKIHPWGKGSDVFFFNLTAPQCRKAGLDTNDACWVTLKVIS